MNKPKRISLKSLSAARQELMITMHRKQFGAIRDLPVEDGEPQLSQARIVLQMKLTRDDANKPISRNFFLKPAHLRLLESLDDVNTGTIELIEFRHGLPCEMRQCTV